jgi:hypothetical protein
MRGLYRNPRGGESRGLSVDPAVESVQLRQRVELLSSWRNFLLSFFLLAAAITWLITSPKARPEAGIATSLATGLVGIMFTRLFDARRGRDGFYRDVITLTSVFYQSPATIRDFLGQESIERSIMNLLKAALQSDELGAAYWQQSVKQFIDFSDRGFKEDWCYSIDLRDLDRAIEIQLSRDRFIRFDPSEYRSLTTSLAYHQTVLQPADIYWVACAFESNTIPAWFRQPNFLLRELVPLPDDVRKTLSEVLPGIPGSPGSRLKRLRSVSGGPDQERRRAIAREIFDANVHIGGEELSADRIFANEEGICWGFAFSEAQQDVLRRSLEVRVEVRTLQPRALGYFPVVINTPTRHPTIRLNYGMCKSIGHVESEVFFSAERPYDDDLRAVSPENRRIEIQTKREDWVLGGSGCVFVWRER